MTPWRQKIRSQLYPLFSDGFLVLCAAPSQLRNGDVSHYYRQDSYFLYLTGITAPNYRLVIDPKAKKSHLFIPDLSEFHQIWEGKQLTVAQAKKQFGFSHVHYLKDWDKVLKPLCKKYKTIHVLPSAKVHRLKFPQKIKSNSAKLKNQLDQLRLFKTADEIKNLKKANDISKAGHIAAMKTAATGITEYQLQAALEKEFLHHGAFHKAYHSIVAAGTNAAILHYVDNNATLKKNDLVLIDAGCEWQGYASDITRTFPVSGKFSTKQSQIYQVVLETQKECINAIQPGASMADIHVLSCKSLLKGLSKLGFFKTDDVDLLFKNEVHRVFYPHGVGHLLGIDVHDVGAPSQSKRRKTKNLRSPILLSPGMVVTVEPGIYFIDFIFNSAQKRKKLEKFIRWNTADRYRHVGGIRIEDDILVTKTGYKNLTSVPKEIKDIEKIMKA